MADWVPPIGRSFNDWAKGGKFTPRCSRRSHSIAVPWTRPQKLGGRPTGFRRAPLAYVSQPVSRVLGGIRAMPRMRDGHSSGTPVTRRLQQPTRTAGSGHRSRSPPRLRTTPSRRPYSVLLPVGFALPPALPPARCALTAPFHPCRDLRNASRRFVLCGTFPRLAPAGRYPAPFVHGARTFLPDNLSVSPERPSGRLTGRGMVSLSRAVKGRRDRSPGPARQWSAPGHAWQAVRAMSRASIDR